jgi:branched-chain amino acid aminotransferase
MSFDPAGLTVYVDGEFVDGAEARIPIWDHGLRYGDGIFEGMRVFDGALFRPRDHIARLGRSARALGLELPLEGEELLDVIREVVARLGLSEAHVRPIVTRGVGYADDGSHSVRALDAYRQRTQDARYLVPVAQAVR